MNLLHFKAQRNIAHQLMAKLMLSALVIGTLACSDNSEILPTSTATPQQITSESETTASAEVARSSTPTPTILPATATTMPAPTPTSSPEPTITLGITETPPTPTIANTSTPEIEETTFNDLGFSIVVESKDSLVLTSLLEEDASTSQGVLLFEYKGIQAVLMWIPLNDNSIQTAQAQLMALLTGAQPGNVFTVITEGNINVDDNQGIFGAFSTQNDEAAVIGGGIIGAWACGAQGIIPALLVTGTDDTTVQIRFKRLIDSFSCEITQ